MTNRTAPKLLAVSLSTLLVSGCLSVMPSLAPKAKNIEANISAEFPYDSKFVSVKGSRMHYVDVGEGPVMVLVHGNPTSSYLWRNVIPELSGSHRVIALDLIGMGQSDKLDIPYRLADHIAYFEGFMEALELEDVTLVLHDWGGGIGLDYAAGHSDNIRAIAVMESVVKPMYWKDADMATKFMFRQFRDPDKGFQINAERNYFVEKLLPMMAGRELSAEEAEVYRAPYQTVESRRPVAQWPMEIPLDGEPADNAARIGANYDWLKSSDVPVLLITATPGVIFNKKVTAEVTSDIPRMEVVNIGSGMHYIQEVQPTLIGQTIDSWSADLQLSEADKG
ncbi:MAG: haloalkane dehalogenase [Pseudomonadota bacterium]